MKACFYFFERGETEGFLQKILVLLDFAIAKAYHYHIATICMVVFYLCLA